MNGLNLYRPGSIFDVSNDLYSLDNGDHRVQTGGGWKFVAKQQGSHSKSRPNGMIEVSCDMPALLFRSLRGNRAVLRSSLKWV